MDTHDARLADLRRQLLTRREALQTEVGDAGAAQRGDDSFAAHAGEVPDSGDASVATHEVDLRQAEIGRDLDELRAVEAALARLDAGEYGDCVDCGMEIPAERLAVAPQAERCVPCQTAFEARHGSGAGPSM